MPGLATGGRVDRHASIHDPATTGNLDDAGPVMREIAWPIPVGLRRIPGRETGD
jgi:hypothetical protein